MKNSNAYHHSRDGQAMLIAVLSLGGAILGATTVAGLLTLYQLRASTDTQNSAKAIFAADAGVEWSLFDYYCSNEGRCPSVTPGANDYAMTSFANGASVAVTCTDGGGGQTICSDAANTVTAVTIGSSLNTRRAFELTLAGATTTTP